MILFDDMIAEMLGNKKRNPVQIELFIRGNILNISFVVITQSYFTAPKILDKTLHIALTGKFQTNESFKILSIIIHQLLTLNSL